MANKDGKKPDASEGAPAAGASPAAAGAEARTITLSDGRIAKVREPIGRDLERGALVASESGSTQTAVMMGVAAQVTTIDGKGVPYEDIQAMPMVDVCRLLAILGNDLSLGPGISLG